VTAQVQSNQVGSLSADHGSGDFRTMSVVVVVPWLDVGGADQVMLDTISTLAGAGGRIHVVTTQPSANRWLARLGNTATSVWNLPALVPPGAAAMTLRDIVRMHDADVVHIANSRLGYDVAPLLALEPRRPIVICHLMGEEGTGNGYPRYAATVHRDAIDLFLVVSDDLKSIVTDNGVADGRVLVVRPGIDLDHFTPGHRRRAQDDPLRLLMPARLSEEKDPLLGLDVLAACMAAGHDVYLTFTGDGPLADELQAEVTARGLSDRAKLTGAVADIREQYQAHDLVLLTSRYEATPLAACEGMACGLPVVAPAVGGIPEIVDDEVGAAIVERTPDALAAAIARFTDEHARFQAGIAARLRAEALFGPATTQEALLNAYAVATRERSAV
jgi:glycosyltransferase involved in cell wall biosynthesis